MALPARFVSGVCGSRWRAAYAVPGRRASARDARDVFRFRFGGDARRRREAGRCGRGGRGVRGRGRGARAGRTFRAPERRRCAAGAQAAYPARILGVSRVRKFFDSNEGCCRLEISTGLTRLHAAAVSMTSAGTRAIPPRAGSRGGSRRASRDVTGTADTRRDAVVVHRETSPV